MNTRRQGDLGEVSAIQWLTHQGADVYVPVGHAPDADLLIRWNGRVLGVQVKTSRRHRHRRWEVAICTRGGNQSWSGLSKRFSPERCDYLFVAVADGRRWFIPAEHVAGESGLLLGGPKYAAFEIEPGVPF